MTDERPKKRSGRQEGLTILGDAGGSVGRKRKKLSEISGSGFEKRSEERKVYSP